MRRSLGSNRLSGTASPGLCDLGELKEYFDLSGNSLSGTLPTQIGKLSRLQKGLCVRHHLPAQGTYAA